MRTFSPQAATFITTSLRNVRRPAATDEAVSGPGPFRQRIARLLQAYGRAAAMTLHR